MSLPEEQEEEKEVLISIYGSDPNFNQTGPSTFQYRVGEVGQAKTFLTEVKWSENYPEELPIINLDLFYNSHLSDKTKQSICTTILSEIEPLLGSPMTYTLIEYIRDNVESLVPEQEKEELDSGLEEVRDKVKDMEVSSGSKKKGKEVLSKAAKRRQSDRLNNQGELPRGWNWVDIIKHLSKTGPTQ